MAYSRLLLCLKNQTRGCKGKLPSAVPRLSTTFPLLSYHIPGLGVKQTIVEIPRKNKTWVFSAGVIALSRLPAEARELFVAEAQGVRPTRPARDAEYVRAELARLEAAIAGSFSPPALAGLL